MSNTEELLEKNEQAIAQIEEKLKEVARSPLKNKIYPRSYPNYSEKQDELIKHLRERCRLLANLSED